MKITNRQEALTALKASFEYLTSSEEEKAQLPTSFQDWLPEALAKLEMQDPGEFARDRLNAMLSDPEKIQQGCLGRQSGTTTLTVLHMIHYAETHPDESVTFVACPNLKGMVHDLCERLRACTALRNIRFCGPDSHYWRGERNVWRDPQ